MVDVAARCGGRPYRWTISPPPPATYAEPVSGTYKEIELVEHPPNGQGATAILMAKILSHFDLPSMDPFGAMRAHVEAEATKLAYDAREPLHRRSGSHDAPCAHAVARDGGGACRADPHGSRDAPIRGR